MADGRVTVDFEVNRGNLDGSLKDLNNNLSNTESQGQKASMSIGKIATALGLVKLASSAIRLLGSSLEGAVSRYDTMNNFPRVMEQMGFEASDSSAAVDKLADGLKGLPTPLNEAVANAQRIAVLTGNLDLATDTTLALNNAFLASGSSSADASRGLTQYVQMLSRGEVDMQSWRTLQETMGPALNDTAKAFGFAGESAQNDLYAALKDGDITFADFNAKIIELDGGVNGFAERAKTASAGIATAFANMRTAVVRGLEGLIRSIDETLAALGLGSIQEIIEGIGSGFEKGLKLMAENLPIVAGHMKDMYDSAKELAPEILALTAAFATYTTIVMFSSWMETAALKLLFFQDAVVKFLAPIKVLVAALGTTVGIVALLVAAVVGLVTWFVIAYRTNEEFRNKVNAAWAAVKDFVIPIIDALVSGFKSMIDWIKENITMTEWFQSAVSASWGFIQSVASATWNFLQTVFSGMMSFFGMIGSAVASGFGIAVGWFSQLASSASELWSAFMESSIVQGALSLMGGIFQNVTGQVTAFFDAFRSAITELDFEPLLQQAALLIPKLIGIFLGGKVGLVLAGANIIKMIADGMGLTVPELIQQVTDIIVNMIEQFALALPLYIEEGTKILTGLIEGFSAAIPGFVTSITEVILLVVNTITTLLPVIIQTGVTLLGSLIQGIAQAFPLILSAAIQIITTLVGGLLQALVGLAYIGLEILTTIMSGLTIALPVLIESGFTIISTLANALITSLPIIIEAGINLITALVNAFVTMIPIIIQTGIDILLALINGLISILPNLIEVGINLITALINAIISLIPVIINAGIQLIMALIGGIIQLIPALISAGIQIITALIKAIISLIPVILSAGVQLIGALIKGLLQMIPALLSAAFTLITGLLGAILKMIPQLLSAGVDLISALVRGVLSMLGSLVGAAADLGSGIINEFRSIDLIQVGKDIINGLISGMGSMVGSAVKAVSNVASNIVSGAKNFLNIKSPSRVFRDEIGKMIPQGIAVGIEADSKDALNAVDNMVADLSMPRITAESALGMHGRMNTNPSNVSTINNNYSYGQEDDNSQVVSLLREIAAKTGVELDGRKLTKGLSTYIDQSQGDRYKMSGWGLETNGGR